MSQTDKSMSPHHCLGREAVSILKAWMSKNERATAFMKSLELIMKVTAESALKILLRRRNSRGPLRHTTRQLIRQTIAQIHAELRGA